MDGVEKANAELFDFLRKNKGTAFVNADDERVLRNAHGLEKITYAVDEAADFNGQIISKFPFIKAEIGNGDQQIQVSSHLFGSFNLYNLLVATAVGRQFGVEWNDIKQALESYVPQNNRSQLIEKDGNTYILDAYNANPSSMGPAVKDFAEYPAQKKVLVLGDMFELGEDSAKEHKAIADSIDYSKFEKVLLIGEAFYELNGKYPAQFFRTTEEAKSWLTKNDITGAVFYLKGSRGMRLETILQ
jgi:UDP-N-acetylmuramoyl-tripeptide--D-alanyl-D-alanine ligase